MATNNAATTEQTTVAQLPTQHDNQKFVVSLTDAKGISELLQSDSLKNIDKLEAAPINIAMQYFDFQQGKAERFMFMGIIEQPTQEGEMLPACVLADKDGNFYTNMGALLVSAFTRNNTPKGSLVEVTWTGTKKVQKGSARTWRVSPLMTPAQ